MAAGQLLGVSPAGVRPRVAVSLGSSRVGRQDSRCAVPGAFLSLLLLLQEKRQQTKRVSVYAVKSPGTTCIWKRVPVILSAARARRCVCNPN